MPEGRWPRGVTPRPRSGAAAESTTATAQERPRGATPRPRSGGAAERRYPAYEVRGSDERRYPPPIRGGQEELPHTPTPEAKGSSREDQPHVQGPVAAWAQEGLEELSNVEGQEGWR